MSYQNHWLRIFRLERHVSGKRGVSKRYMSVQEAVATEGFWGRRK